MTVLVFIAAMVFLNRFRGGGFGAAALPGHPRYYVAPMVFLFAGTVVPVLPAAGYALAYFAWSLMPWGHAIGLGRWSPDRPPSLVESWFMHEDNPWLRLLSIELAGLIPATLLVSAGAPVFGAAFVGCYEIGWRLTPKAPIQTAEILVGILWAAMLGMPV